MATIAITLSGIEAAVHPRSPGGSAGGVRVLLLLAFAVSCGWFARWLVGRLDPGADDSDDGETGGGGWGRGPSPSSPPPDADPEWWPEFEREFAAYTDGAAYVDRLRPHQVPEPV
jgi:hypothetical protein